jgi:hypothetical protein
MNATHQRIASRPTKVICLDEQGGDLFAVRGSRFAVRGSRFAVRGSR